MIAISATAMTCDHRGRSAQPERHRPRSGAGLSCRKCEASRNAVRIAPSLARGRRIYPSAAARSVEPENFRAGGRRPAIRSTPCRGRGDALRLVATETVGPPAPRKTPMTTVTPSDELGAAICVQNSGRGRRDARQRSGVRRAAEENGCSKSKLACPHEGPSLAPTHARTPMTPVCSVPDAWRAARLAGRSVLTFWAGARG